MKAIRHIIRGCGTLPHVGEHPGTVLIFVFLVLGALAGSKNGGWQGALFGAGVMAAVFVPMYLYGAYSRSVDSDEYENRATKE